jgi:GNAT superfamily N-acetyltransferase
MRDGVELSFLEPPFGDHVVDCVVSLSTLVFGDVERDYVTWRLERMPDLSIGTAWLLDERLSNELIGFKAGYAFSATKYYSWLSGVHPDYRGEGISSALMHQQHQWIARRGFTQIETATEQGNQAMTRLNLAHGFAVTGFRAEPDRNMVVLSKLL